MELALQNSLSGPLKRPKFKYEAMEVPIFVMIGVLTALLGLAATEPVYAAPPEIQPVAAPLESTESSVDRPIIEKRQIEVGSNSYIITILRPMMRQFPKSPSENKQYGVVATNAIQDLQQAYYGLVDEYLISGLVKDSDTEMLEKMLLLTFELDATTLIIKRLDKNSKAPQFSGMVRALYSRPDRSLPAEKAFSLEPTKSPKAEISSYAFKDPRLIPPMSRILSEELQYELNHSPNALLFVQTAEGLHERTYHAFYGFETIGRFKDPRIEDRTSVVMRTTLFRLVKRLGKRFSAKSEVSHCEALLN